MTDDQLKLQHKLREKFAETKARNPAYTLRAYSRKLGLNSGALSTILNGKRRVSYKLAERIVDKLLLDPQERAEVLGSFPDRNRHIRPERKGEIQKYLQLSADQFHAISEWYHFAILSLIKIPSFKNDPEWIADHLGISKVMAKGAIERLTRLGMIVLREDGSIERGAPAYRTTDDVANISLRRAHAQNLELAKQSLERDAVNERDFSSITMAIDSKKLPLAKEQVRKFQDELAELLASPTPDRVYKACFQIIPLSK